MTAVFPAAARTPDATDDKQIVNVLDTSSAVRVSAAVSRVRGSIIALLRERKMAFTESMSTTELAVALSSKQYAVVLLTS